jgi:hypothetical protein
VNRAALLLDLRNAALTFQARTLETMLRYNLHSPEAEGPMSEANRNNPLTVTPVLPTQGTQKGDL